MGMSSDYPTAVMLGATAVRVGSALFERLVEVPAALRFGREIVGVVRVDRHVVRDPLDHRDPFALQPGDLGRIVGQQPDRSIPSARSIAAAMP